ncbi:glycosyltransferase family 2 protein [Wenyingzhuangia sp. 2_MG-2023]|uniref:glycosyltransferase family 2 protein n=1 Tax=Wenyingzhuangia sp. 2_MG-2023 TaxID=3062639 RepID=UPI0026E24693|nr:glycosyltransferase family 2 protein [Wenyingzhuangia sp. 2_MG-2023]MDO6738378.1 glycosyltransferase [Wenyingzhuangia sp. 2_MG-2023]
MDSRLRNDLWEFKEAKKVTGLDKVVFLGLTFAGVLSILNLAEWWFKGEHISNLFLFIVLSLFFWYGIVRVVLIWVNYLRIKKPDEVPVPEENMSVAVYTTSAPGEPLSMFENTFKALQNLNYPHTTYLLDSTEDIAFRKLAEEYGVVWLDLANLPGAKAGKINETLKRTKEEFILILDPDHIVFPNFLDQTLGFFKDKSIGFVQVSQGYYNMYRSFTAKGAAEQTYTFYGPTQMGLYGYGGAVAIGANCTFRREALESIGGHAQGLAEDLQTSIRIHAKGWKSVYNPVIVSRGLVPEDFASFCKQQLKWARGVFELLFDEMPNVLKDLTFWQKITYLSIGTYYLFGAITAFFIFIPLLFFVTKITPAIMDFTEFFIHGSIVLLIAVLIYAYAQRFLCDRKTEKGFHWRGMVLKYSCWPVFAYAFYLTLINKKIPYIPTAKIAVKGFMNPFVKPLLMYCVLFLLMLIGVYVERRYYISESELIFTAERTWAMIGFSMIALVQSIGGIGAAYQSMYIKAENAWNRINISSDKKINIKKKN